RGEVLLRARRHARRPGELALPDQRQVRAVAQGPSQHGSGGGAMIRLALCLGALALAASALAAEVSPKAAEIRRHVVQAERSIDRRFRSAGEAQAMTLLGAARGVYLDRYGPGFTLEVNLYPAAAL